MMMPHAARGRTGTEPVSQAARRVEATFRLKPLSRFIGQGERECSPELAPCDDSRSGLLELLIREDMGFAAIHSGKRKEFADPENRSASTVD